MAALCPASEVILRHADEFTERQVLFAGDLQDAFANQFDVVDVRVHCTQYHQWQRLSSSLESKAQFGLRATAEFINTIDTVIFYWPKSKQEAQFQLQSLFSQLPIKTDVFIVGENRSGVRSAETLLANLGSIAKIDSARRCSLYHFRLEKPVTFDLSQWWDEYRVDDVVIKTLPGVFSRDGLDVGSQLLLSALGNVNGHLLDLGCGAGVLSAVVAKHNPEVTLTLSDVNALALESSRATLAANGLQGNVIASDVFSAITDRFNVIISNPPFHDGLQTNLSAAKSLIQGAAKHLAPGGKLCIVANAFLPYPDMLDATFGRHDVLAQTGRFKIYQAIQGQKHYSNNVKKHTHKR